MNKCSNRITSSLFLSMLMVILFNNFSLAQEKFQMNSTGKIEKAEIQWIGQWPAAEDNYQEKVANPSIPDFLLGVKRRDFKRPVSLIVDDQNSYWILDQQNNAVFQVTKGVGKVPRFIEKANLNFSSLVGICKYRDNKILFTDSHLNKIYLINADKKECTVLNKSLKLDRPTGIAYSSVSNEIWVLETGAHRILVLNDKGEIIKTIGSRGVANGQFNFPTHIWIDKSGTVYVVDAMNFRVQIFNKEGSFISVFGSNGDATGFFASPKGIATDSYGHIYVADALFHAIQIFDVNGNFLYSFGSQGQAEGEFWMPSGIYIDENNKIYVADTYNSRIQIFQLIPG